MIITAAVAVPSFFVEASPGGLFEVGVPTASDDCACIPSTEAVDPTISALDAAAAINVTAESVGPGGFAADNTTPVPGPLSPVDDRDAVRPFPPADATPVAVTAAVAVVTAAAADALAAPVDDIFAVETPTAMVALGGGVMGALL